MCLWIYQGGRFPLSLKLPLIHRIEYNCYTTIIFGETLEPYYLETLKKTRLKLFHYQKQYRH